MIQADHPTLKSIAQSVRTLSMDAVQKANSGHPGLPLGIAELGASLFANVMNYNPANPKWPNRDRFVLSAGHGSMFQYSLLHLAGFNLSLDDVKNFRQLGSKTPGHPEYGYTDGVETTTGPLGAGISNAVGLAMGETMLADRFNTSDAAIIDHFTYVVAGDGCMMEGVASEAASLAGHLKLGKLIAFYDSNKITIEGSTDLAFTEDVAARYEAYGWQVLKGSAYDFDGIESLVSQAKAEVSKPSLIVLTSTIGYGAPNKQGSHSVHGSPLGDEEIKASRKFLGTPVDQDFYVAPEALSFFKNQKTERAAANAEWDTALAVWKSANPEKAAEWAQFFETDASAVLEKAEMPVYEAGHSDATRSYSGKALNAVANALPNLIGGSADLAPSNNTAMPGKGEYGPDDRSGRTIHFGVREHGMGGVMNGLALYGGFRVFGATFLVFADYMRPAIRLASLMKLPVTYVFTHDSIFVGEDGPTHQPVEHAASLRIIPNLSVLRPADGEEVNEAWKIAASATDAPTALLLTRQKVTTFAKADADWKTNYRKGGYVAVDCDGTPDVVIAATGSELGIAREAAETATAAGKKVRVVSISSREWFLAQDKTWQAERIPAGVPVISVEAGIRSGWDQLSNSYKGHVGIESFGESGPGAEVAKHLGLTAESIVKLINS